MSRNLPDRPSLEHLKKQARERLRVLQAREPAARLADAQRAIAREYGFASWPKRHAPSVAAAASREESRSVAERATTQDPTQSAQPPAGRNSLNDSGSLNRAIAVELRRAATGALLGVAVVVPSDSYVAVIHEGSFVIHEPHLAAKTWDEIEQWTIGSDVGLPARPRPLHPSVAAAILGTSHPPIQPAIVGERFASFPLNGSAEVRTAMKRLLPGLLSARRSAVG